MNASFTLGRVAGIRIGIHWSWLVVFALIVWSLADGVFPRQNEGLSDGTYLAMGVAGALLFFLSVLLHELGHALEARRRGMEIDGIVLWLFGGVAQFRGGFPSAAAELSVALAGPLVSLALGLGLIGFAAAVPSPEPVDGVAAYLGSVNLLLLAFNLLPALPLDGGRVLRSVLWAARGELAWATRVAAGIGRGFGYVLIGLGVVLFVSAGAFAGAWLAFLGWFLLGAATAEARHLAVREALGGLAVRDLMARDPDTVPASMSLADFMDDVLWSTRHTTYPVVRDGRAVGLLPFRRVAEVRRSDWDRRRVADCMLPREDVPSVAPDDELVDAIGRLEEGGIGRALVLDGDRVVGLLSRSDVVRALDVGPPRRRRRRVLARPWRRPAG